MASYHFSVQIVKRSAGRSVIAMAAYRAGERLHDSRRGVTEDYSNRRGVVHREILAPEGSAAWLRDREALWNAVEYAEKRVDAQLAREINLALPHELSHEQRLDLVRGFVAEQFVARGMIADLAIHEPVVEKGDNHLNHHAHILLTLRQGTPEGLRRVKTREWNADALLGHWRASWAEHQNRALARQGYEVSVDHRSLAMQLAEAREKGDLRRAVLLDREPEIHVGPLARQAASHGAELPSHDRAVGPRRYREPGQPPSKRIRLYTRFDRGNRLDWVSGIIRRNDLRARSVVERLEIRQLGLRRKLAYWEQRAKRGGGLPARSGGAGGAAGLRQGAPGGGDRKRELHAGRRVALLQRLLLDLGNVLRAMRRQREANLMRSRDFSGWMRELGRMLDRSVGLER